MKINSNVGLRDRSRITLGGFKGLDTLSAAVDVSAIHATEMKNLISRDGVNHKRFGWKTQYRIRDDSRYLKIQGIFSFTIFTIEFLMVYAGYQSDNGEYKYRFYLIDKENNASKDITQIRLDKNGKIVMKDGECVKTTVSPVETDKLRDNECKCFINGNKVYFVGCGDFLVFSKWLVGDEEYFELRRVVGNDDVYIPTTTENIGCEEEGQNYTRITAEERNILSPYTKNLLFGPKLLYGKDDETQEGGIYDSVSYYLDTTDFEDIEVRIQRPDETVVVLEKTEGEGYVEGGDYYKEGDKIEQISIKLPSISSENTWLGTVERSPSGSINDSASLYYYCCVTINVQEEITLIQMKNGDKLAIKTEVETQETQPYEIVEGVDIYYEFPYEIKYKLVYIESNGNIKDLTTEAVTKVNCSIQNAEVVESSNSHVELTAKISYSYGKLSCDLTNYTAEIEKLYPDMECGKLVKATVLVGTIDGYIYRGKFNGSIGKLVLDAVEELPNAYAPLVPDVPNIEVKLKKSLDSSIVATAMKACEFGAQGGTDRLFIGDSSGNTVRWSKDNDFTYFGEKSWCVCGTSDKSITGMDRLNDSTLLIVKEYSSREPSIFIITGNIITGETEAGTVDYTALFTPHGYQVGVGAVGEIVNFNGDCLMVAKDGLYAVSLGENMTVDSRYVLHRSRQISNQLEKFDLSKAKCVSFNGNFFVAVGGEEQECYIADNKYTTSFKGDIQNGINYEWWRWTNIPVNVWGFVENELWFGTNDGQLCCFTENFYDETFSSFPAGSNLICYDMDCEHNDEACECGNIIGFDLVSDIKCETGDVLTPTCDFYGGITTNKFECVDGETKFYLPLNDYLNGEKIYIENKAYAITKHGDGLYFSIPYATDLTELMIYRNYKDKPLTVIYNDNDFMVLKDSAGNFPTWAKIGLEPGLNPSNGDFSATLSHKEPVVSKWVSGAMDLGTRAYSKSLTYLVLTGEKDLSNRLKYGLKTRFTHRDYELLRANNDLDFNELDLETVSMDSDFASSYTRRLNIRNINFLMFYFVSDTAEDIALNSIQIEFKLNKRNIGVR